MRWLRNNNPCTQERALHGMNTSCWSDSGSGQASWAGFELSSAYAAPERQAQLFQSIQIHDGTDPVKETMGLSPIRFPCSPEWWRGDEALQAEAQAPQAPREQGDQAAGNVPALRPRSLFSAGVRFATASHMPVDTAQ